MMVDSSFSQKKQLHFSRNFSDVVEYLIPKYYVIEDEKTIETATNDIFDVVINSHLQLADNIENVLDFPKGIIFSSISSFDGIAPFFDKKNLLTNIDKLKFEREILYPKNKSFKDFGYQAAFQNYLETSLIPELRNSWSDAQAGDFYLSRLGWFYILATSSTDNIQPSSIVVDYFSNYLFYDKNLSIAEGVNALTEYLWKNELGYIPNIFLSGTSEYVSGNQQLDNLKTLNEILYSNSYLNKKDSYVNNSFDNYSVTKELNENLVKNGPFWKLLKAFSFSFADSQNEVNKLKTLYDLQDCPDEYLPELAHLLGWKLLGYDRNKWRLQLANALTVYKRAGTKQSIQIALNNLFGEGGINLDSHLSELWESYLPFLIMYALATESSYFSDYTTYTRDIAESLGIDNYDISNFENNIRAGVDKILETLYFKYPNNFRLAGRPFPRNSESFIFKYRGKIHPIPPFEEIPYYMTSEVNGPFLDELLDLLICFGVRQTFARELINYVKSNTIDNLEDIALDNAWLIFTSSLELPPNWDSIVEVGDKRRSEFLSLWNGKSSHFKLDFSGVYDFNKIQFTPDSKYALMIAARTAQEFSPAHAIPLVTTHLSDSDSYSASGNLFTEVLRDFTEFPPFSNNFRNIGPNILGSLQKFNIRAKERLGSLYSPSGMYIVDDNNKVVSSVNYTPTFNTKSLVTDIPRLTARRRNYKNALDLFGYFDRTGFNPPVFRIGKIPDLSPEEDSKLISKGFIPSAFEFVSTSASCSGLLSSIPDVYKSCSPYHRDKFYGYYLSATIPVRGVLNYQEDLQGSSLYQDRAQLDPFMYLLYKIEQRKLEAESYKELITNNQAYYLQNSYWLNVSASEANKKLSCLETKLSSLDGYYDYSLGRKIHKLYNEYSASATGFNNHPLTYQVYNKQTTDILRHCFGSILQNSDFESRGAYGSLFYTTDPSDQKLLTLRTDPYLRSNFNTYGTITNTASELVVARSTSLPVTTELVNSNIIEGVDLIHTSGSSEFNEFTIYDVALGGNEFSKNNSLLKLRSVNGLPRLRFSVSGCNFLEDSWGNFRNTSFLSPNHKFKVTLKGLASLNNGTALTNAQVGVWIHTKAVNNKSWHFNSAGKWEQLNQTEISIPKIVSELCHKVSFDPKTITTADEISPKIFRCLKPNNDPESESGPLQDPAVLFDADYFSEASVFFDTFISCDAQTSSSLHNYEQHYIIEVFMIPDRTNINQFILLDNISLRDETLWDYTRLELAGDLIPPLYNRYCNAIRMDLSEEEIRIILQTFGKFAGKSRSSGFLSRDKSKSNTVHLRDGGSRESYRDIIENYDFSFTEGLPGLNGGGQASIIDFREPTAEELIVFSNFFSPPSQVAEAIETVPVEGESALENIQFGFWIG